MPASTPASSSPATEARAHRLARALPLAACLVAVAPAAADLLDVAVERSPGGFDIRFDIVLEVPPAHVQRLFTEPERWTALSKVILSSKHVDHAVAGSPVETVFRDCILFFCREVRKVATYRIRDPGLIVGRSVPGAGHFRHTAERWQLLPVDGGTRILFDGRIEPDFTVPPMIGPMLMRATLKRLLREMEQNLEAMAIEDVRK